MGKKGGKKVLCVSQCTVEHGKLCAATSFPWKPEKKKNTTAPTARRKRKKKHMGRKGREACVVLSLLLPVAVAPAQLLARSVERTQLTHQTLVLRRRHFFILQ